MSGQLAVENKTIANSSHRKKSTGVRTAIDLILANVNMPCDAVLANRLTGRHTHRTHVGYHGVFPREGHSQGRKACLVLPSISFTSFFPDRCHVMEYVVQ